VGGNRVDSLEYASLGVDDVSTFVGNPRRGDVAAIAASLRVRGQYRPVVVNRGTFTGRPLEVLAGNHTVLAARSLGWPVVQAALVDVDDATAAQIVAADNRLADLGSYDDADVLALLERAGDLEGTGYTAADVAALLAGTPVALTDPDAVPPLPVVPVSAVGDVWLLGPHRLVVGDAGDADVLGLAVGDDVADCVWTDPPYGVNYTGPRQDRRGLVNDGGAGDAVGVLAGFLQAAPTVCRPGAAVYVAMPPGPALAGFVATAVDAGVRVRQLLVWVKDRFVVGHSDYHYQHEFVLAGDGVDGAGLDFEPVALGYLSGGSGQLGRGGPRWHGDNRASTVLEVRAPKASREHPTMKPVELIAPMLRNSCPVGGLVLDAFAGSGSTMLAAHGLGMRAALVEIDPLYADVVCRRWQEHTGVVPLRDGTPVDFVGG